jgi:Leucine-rich repeat (LRR) protein
MTDRRAFWAGLDSRWKSALSKSLGLDGEECSDEDLQRLFSDTELELYEAGIRDLTPIAQLTQLEKLDLYGNGFSDLRPLAALRRLKSLRLGNCNEVEDLSPIAALTELEDLDASCPSAKDFTVLRSLQKLTWLLLEVLEPNPDREDELLKQIALLEEALPNCRVETKD